MNKVCIKTDNRFEREPNICRLIKSLIHLNFTQTRTIVIDVNDSNYKVFVHVFFCYFTLHLIL